MCPIVVGAVYNFGRSEGDTIQRLLNRKKSLHYLKLRYSENATNFEKISQFFDVTK